MDTKKWYLSKTIWGIIIAIIAQIIAWLFGVEVSKGEQIQIIDLLLSIIPDVISLAGIILAIYGRIVADKKIA